MRGCQSWDTVIDSVATGRAKLSTAGRTDVAWCSLGTVSTEFVTSATRSDAHAIAKAAEKLGTTATMLRANPSAAKASSTGPFARPRRDATTWPKAA